MASITSLTPQPFSQHSTQGVLSSRHAELDTELLKDSLPTRIAGFDLAQPQLRGKPASTLIDGLSRHLIDTGKASEPTANRVACQLLAKLAPEFLLRDIPASVTFGSVSWVQMAIATGCVESVTPGRSSTMTYAEVMASAETGGYNVAPEQRRALTQWGGVNGRINNPAVAPTDAELEQVRVAYNGQVQALTASADAQLVRVPSRREIALTQLQAAFPTMDASLFEAKTLQKVWLNPGRPGAFPGLYSMLDVVMEGAALGDREHWTSTNTRIPAKKFCALYEAGKLDAASAFKTDYDNAILALEAGHEGLARYLMSTAAPDDRANFESGELEFFQTNEYRIAGDFFTPQALSARGQTLRIKTTRNGVVNVYELDTRNGSLTKQNYLISRYTPPYTAKNLESREANIVSRTTLINPLKDEQPAAGTARIDYIARVFAKSLDLGNKDLLAHARGVTAYDESRATGDAVGEFFLNLIPLRSAIVNFSNGNHAEGVFDLTMDVIGLFTLGVGKGAQAAKAFSKGVTTASGLARVGRFVGTGLIEVFNPLSGLGDVAKAGTRAVKGGITALDILPANHLDNALYSGFKAAESKLAGLTRNSQGVYVAADGHLSHIRHVDSSGRSAVYEVRQVSRTEDGVVQARVYHNNRQTELVVQHVQGDQWQRVVARGGNRPSVAADLGPKIGGGAEGTVYASLDGKSVYKDFGVKDRTTVPDYVTCETRCLNTYYGDGFAEAILDDGRAYIKMKRLDGVTLDDVPRRSLPAEARTFLDQALAGMEAKGIYHNDLQLKNFLYSAKDKKVYPVDIQSLDPEVMAGDAFLRDMTLGDYQRKKTRLQSEFDELVVTRSR